MNPQEKNTITLDAAEQKLGRLASRVAVLLQGKDRADYAPNKVANVEVVIENIDQLAITDTQKGNKSYQSFSGYPGGLKTRSMQQIIDKKGYSEIFRTAVNGMLPKNKLQKLRLKNLTIKSS